MFSLIKINDPQLHKQIGETERQHIWRIGQLYDSSLLCKDDGVADVNWNDLAKLFNAQWREDGIEWTESTYRKRYAEGLAWLENVFKNMGNKDYADELDLKQRELQKERYKLQTEKLEYNRWLRENARDELFSERIIEAIKSTATDYPGIKYIPSTDNGKEHALFIADTHFGKEFWL